MSLRTIRRLVVSFGPLLIFPALWLLSGHAEESNLDKIKSAAERGDAEAELLLGRAYMRGEGVSQDYVRAAELFRKSADQGNPKSQNNLGQMYSEGQGLEKDPVKAYQWLTLTANQGEITAKKFLFQIEATMTADQIAEGNGWPRNSSQGWQRTDGSWCTRVLGRNGKTALSQKSDNYLVRSVSTCCVAAI